MNTRIHRAQRWRLGLLAVVGASVWYALFLFEEIAATDPEVSLVRTIVRLGVASVLLALLWLWVIWAAPRCLTQQGVSVDEAGITLVQEPRLWLEDRTVFLPWEDVRMVRDTNVGSRMGERVVKVFLHGPGMLTHAPTWCAVSPHEDTEVPATPQQPLTKVTLSAGRKFGAVLKAVQQRRPDLMPM